MAAYADGREYDINDTLEAGGATYVVVAVSHQNDDDGNKQNFQYTIRNKEEADAEAAAERQREIDAKNAEEAAASQASEETPTPDEIAKQSAEASENAVDVNDKEAVAKAHEEFKGELSVNEEPAEKEEAEPEETPPGKSGNPLEAN